MRHSAIECHAKFRAETTAKLCGTYRRDGGGAAREGPNGGLHQDAVGVRHTASPLAIGERSESAPDAFKFNKAGGSSREPSQWCKPIKTSIIAA